MISISILCALIIYLFGGYLDSANDQHTVRQANHEANVTSNEQSQIKEMMP
jgi:hypothetical protein